MMEAMTLISAGLVPDAVYEHAAVNLSIDEITAAEWFAIVINAWNKFAISGRHPLGLKSMAVRPAASRQDLY